MAQGRFVFGIQAICFLDHQALQDQKKNLEVRIFSELRPFALQGKSSYSKSNSSA